MEGILENLNKEREEIIAGKYLEAVADLTSKVRTNPFQKEFIITSGCDTLEITEELSKRFNQNGMSTTIKTGGFFTTTYSLGVIVSLPQHLVKEEEPVKEEPVKQE